MASPPSGVDRAELAMRLRAMRSLGARPSRRADSRAMAAFFLEQASLSQPDFGSPRFAAARALAGEPAALLSALADGADPRALIGAGANLPWPCDSPSATTPLHLCAAFDLWRHARVLMDAGADPCAYVPEAQTTALGFAAYCGSARTLCEMSSRPGADSALLLLPEHAPGSPNSAGSTLLHRIANRPIRAKAAMAAILACSRRCYPDLLARTDVGETPLDWAEGDDADEFRTALLSCRAAREREDLAAAAPRAGCGREPPRI